MQLSIGNFVLIVIRHQFKWKGLNRTRFVQFSGKVHELTSEAIIIKGIFQCNGDIQQCKKKVKIKDIFALSVIAEDSLSQDERDLIDGKIEYPSEPTLNSINIDEILESLQ